jgi:hypothetical protein
LILGQVQSGQAGHAFNVQSSECHKKSINSSKNLRQPRVNTESNAPEKQVIGYYLAFERCCI